MGIGFGVGVIEGNHWAAGLVPHPSQGGDTRFARTSPPPKKIQKIKNHTAKNQPNKLTNVRLGVL
ncbi:hypothetical protein LEP1GSC195_2864 [Leptospira wolbachii serovar Codice str. CDC]|uniref:Uncharacterized protein n=1 Tax=Leptospira wolbachii serovar Codice str. CDC TaxID=1218599 RepID=R8ZZB3_9LEPT|nr:hypothetical protein LEP1GSC195_2864 [Leptospira wolbachii serovar Codice str. CDC]